MVSKPKYRLSDLILSESNLDELQTVIKAKEYWNKVFVDWNLQSVMKQRKSLFINLYGEPGTGKTMAAHAIANALHKEMICVNYADIESKYVGETSKNLTNLFHTASEKDIIIFFDEADALLSKRVTNMSSSTDVSVNQTRSVLLTLLNDYEGMVIFATNFISNYDPALCGGSSTISGLICRTSLCGKSCGGCTFRRKCRQTFVFPRLPKSMTA